MKPRIVLSGVNFIEGGPLAVFQDALHSLSKSFLDRFDVTALVHRRELFDIPGITFLGFPEIKGSWLRRLHFEYVRCRSISRELEPFLWLAMHDITPNVSAQVRAVYCHNPAPFHRLSLNEALLDRTFALFQVLYRFFYAFNISKNDFVIVQQDWIRDEFRRWYHVQNVVVAHPSIAPYIAKEALPVADEKQKDYIFFYPALSRTFKNFELLLGAARLLEEQSVRGFTIHVTIDGTENKYSAKLRQSFGDLKSIGWLGRQTRACVEDLYLRADCLVFPSKLETWGMPISEWKRTGKPMLVADLPYAHETVGDYEQVTFVNAYNEAALAKNLLDMLRGNVCMAGSHAEPVAAPFARDWQELFELLLQAHKTELAVSSSGETSRGARNAERDHA